jgi:hypothetical protein
MSEPIVVNQSTSVVQVDTSTVVYPNNAVVLLSSITARGTIITIRDITGYASTNRGISVSTTTGVHYLDGPGCNVYNINQPYGFLTVTPRTSNVWAVINTFAFPDEAAHPSVEGINARQGNFSNLSGNTGAFNNLTVFYSTFMNVATVSSVLAMSFSTQNLAVSSNLSALNISTSFAKFSSVTINNPLTPSTSLEVNGSIRASTIFLTNSAYVRGSLVYNTNNIVSTVEGLGTASYLSSGSLVSTVQGLGSATYISSPSLASTVQGLGTATYVSSSSLVSTVKGLGTATYVSSSSLVSTVQGLGTASYISTSGLMSTVQGLGSAGYLSSPVTGLISSIIGLGSSGYVSTTMMASTVQGLGSSQYVSAATMASTVIGLGSSLYVSTSALVSTTQGLGTAGYISSSSLTSTVQGLGTVGYVSSTGLVSTVQGLGTASYLSSSSLVSTVQGLGTSSYISSASLASTIQGLGSAGYISSPNVVISSLSTYSLTVYGPSTFINASNVFIGASISTNTLRFIGTYQDGFGEATQYTNTVIAERIYDEGLITVEASELLLFKGNDGSLPVTYGPGPDRVRVLAAGGFRVDIASNGGFWPVGGQPPSTTIKAFTINCNGYVGIGCNTPSFTLDVAGTINACNIGINGSILVTTSNLVSSVQGLGTSQYVSSTALASTVQGLGTSSYISSTALISTVQGLGTAGYVSSYGNALASTVQGLGTSQYVSSTALASTVQGLGTSQYVSSTALASTVQGLGTSSYISSSSLASTVQGLGTAGYLSSIGNALASTVQGLGSSSYVSSTHLASTVQGLGSSQYVSSTHLASTVQGLGSSQYVSSTHLASTVQGLGSSSYVSSTHLASTVQGLGSSSYVSSTHLASTVQGLGLSGYISSPDVSISSLSTYSLTVYGPSTFVNASNVFIGASVSTNVLRFIGTSGDSTQLYTNTVIGERIYEGTAGSVGESSELLLFKGNDAATPFGPDRVRVLSPGGFQVDISTESSWPVGDQPPPTAIQAFYIGCNGRVGIGCNSPSYTLDVNGSINASGTINARGFVNSDNLLSTVQGLGTSSYISSTTLASTVQGLGTSSYISSTGLVSTVQGLGTAGYVSSYGNALASTVQGLGSSSYISSSSLVSTVQGLGQIFLSSPVTGLVSTVQGLGSSRYISSPIVSLSTVSTQSLIAFGESTFLFSSNVYIGNSLSTNILRFYGTTAYNSFGANQYARTVIAERSFSNDTSELLLFKANNALGVPGSDNVRVLAAGGFQVDIASNGGVWPINGNPPSTVIRAFTVFSNGYVGIGCNSPRSTLDVNGIVNVSCNIYVNGLPVVTFGNGLSSNYVPTSNFLIGASSETNTLRFLGTNLDGFNDVPDKKFTCSAIGERIYSPLEFKSELLLFKGDNARSNAWGPDRVRVLTAGGFVVDISPEGCNWPINSDPPPALISNAFSIGTDGVIRTASTIIVNGSPVITSGGAGGSIVLSCNVGINCNTPAYTLDVGGLINASCNIYVNGNPVVTSGGAGGVIVLSCNVGINCNVPRYTLDVNGCLNVSGCNVAAYQWIAVGDGTDKILKSSDGYVWSATSGATFTTSGSRVAWNGSNQWIAVGSGTNTILKSSDGNTWTAVTGPTFTVGKDVVWNGTNLWVAVGNGNAANSIWRSANGTSWTASSTGFSSGGYAVATSGSYWIAVGSGGSTAANQKYSGDGITWSNTTGGGGFSNYDGGRGVAFNGSNMWVAVGYGTTAANSILYSTSGGQIWNNAVTGGFSSYGTSVTWNGSLWVATGIHSSVAGNIQISLDGMNWVPSLSGAFSLQANGVVWSGTKFIATGKGSSSILYSDDGRNWSSCNVSGVTITNGSGIGYGRTLTGPLYALTVSGDTFINGTLYINGLPAGAAAGGSGGSGGGGGGGGGSALPINIELVSSLVGTFGTVGIGCNAPSYTLDVNGTINASSNVFINGSPLLAASSLYSTVRGLGSVSYVSTTQMNLLINNTFVSSIRGLGESGYVSSLTNLSNVTNVNSLQGVFSSIGVNCNLPAYTLDVNGSIQTGQNLWVNSGEFTVGPRELTSTRGLLRIVTQQGASFIQSGSNPTPSGVGPIYFTPVNVSDGSNSAVMAIDISNSRVGINKPNPGFPLDVSGNTRITGTLAVGGLTLPINTWIRDSGGQDRIVFYANDPNTNAVPNSTYFSSPAWYYFQSGAGYPQVSISSNGNIVARGNITANGAVLGQSDMRLKENVITIDNALERISQIRGVFYNKIDDPDKIRSIGVIAQEIETILPEVVHTDIGSNHYKSVAYGNITAVLIEGIKEQAIQISTLQSSYNTLVSQMSTVMAKLV